MVPSLGRLMFIIIGVMVLILVGYYYVGLLKKEYASNCLSFSLASIESANDSSKKENRILGLISYVSYMNKIIDRNPGYWKPIYKVFHTQASLLLFQGRPWEAAEKLKKSLKFHPYYSSAYKMLGNIKALLGLDKGKEACYRVHKIIFQSQKPSKHDIDACLNL